MPIDNENLADLPNGYRINGYANYCQNTKPNSALQLGDRWFKPADGSQWYWSGAYWLSLDEFTIKSDYNEIGVSNSQNLSGSTLVGRGTSIGKSAIFFLSATSTLYFSFPTTTTEFWTVEHSLMYADGSVESIGLNTATSRPASSWLRIETAINSPKQSLTKTPLLSYASAYKSGAATPFQFMTEVCYKYLHL